MWMPGFILDNLSLILCSVVMLLAFTAKTGKSDLIALGVWIALGVVMAFASNLVLSLAKSVSSNGYVIWYGAWALFDLIGLYALYLLHRYFKCSSSQLALLVSISFVILAVLQGVGFIDRGVLGWKSADDFYRYMILAVNIAIVPMSVFYIWPSVKKNLLPRLMSSR